MVECEEDYIVNINDTSLLNVPGDGLTFVNSSCVRDKDKDLLALHFNDYEAAGFTSVYTVLTVVSLFANCLMLYIVVRRTVFRTTPNIFVASLNVSNIFLSAMWIPLLWRPTYSRIFDNSTFFCKIARSSAGINVCCTEIVVAVIITYYVFNPRRLFRLKWIFSLLSVFFIWLVAYAANGINLVMYTTESISINVSQAMQLKIDYHFLPSDDNGTTMMLKYCLFESSQCDKRFRNTCLFENKKYYYKLIQTIIFATFLYAIPFVVFSVRLFVKHCFQKFPFSKNTEIRREVQSLNCLLMMVAQIYALTWMPRICLAFYLNVSQLKNPLVDPMKNANMVQEVFALVSLVSTLAVPSVFGFKDAMFQYEFKVVLSHLFCCLPQYHHEGHIECPTEVQGSVPVAPLVEAPSIRIDDSSFPLIDEETEFSPRSTKPATR